ncbi:MAG: histidine phosphatase family protein, partial [Burkholderiales bacterium]|nr:histidine phosphatase family protein [Burkholderiales bacterium]
MDLILWRHAQAVMLTDEAGEPLPFELERDLPRVLTPKGERQAARMAEWLNQRLPASTRVLV